jgi:hypothetical protein
MIYKTNPTGFDQLKPNEANLQRYKIGNKFLVGYQIADWSGNVKNISEYFFPIFTLHNYKKNEFQIWEEKSSIILDTITCDKFDNKTKSFNLSNYLCPDTSKLPNLEISGDFSHMYANYISFRLSLYDKDYKECKDIEKTQKYFQENELLISSLFPKIDYFIDNVNNPFIKEYHEEFNFITNDNFLFEQIIFQNNELEEDIGYIFKESKFQNEITVQDFRMYSNPRSRTDLLDVCKIKSPQGNLRDHNYFLAEIYYASSKQYHYRQYLKLPDVFANVGGLMDFISSFLVLIMSFYGKWRLDGYLCQRLLYIEDEQGKNFNGEVVEIYKDIEKINNYKSNFKKKFDINSSKKSNNYVKNQKKNQNKNQNKKKEIEEKKIKEELKNNNINNERINKDKFLIANNLGIISNINETEKIKSQKKDEIKIQYLSCKECKREKKSDDLEINDSLCSNKIEMSNIELINNNSININDNNHININENNPININENNPININENNSININENNPININENYPININENNLININENNLININENNPINNDFNNSFDCSSDRNINIDDNKQNEKFDFNYDDMKNYFEISINKFWSFKNTLEFNIKNFIIYMICPKKNLKLRNNYSIIESYNERIYDKFDIFYYLRELKKSEYLQNIIFEKDQIHLIETISQKLYRVSFEENKEVLKDNENFNNQLNFLRENNAQIMKYLLEENKKDLTEAEKKILNKFIN